MEMTRANTAIYRVDFNTVHPDTWNVLGTTEDMEQYGHLVPSIGQTVLLVDGEGNRCLAQVVAIDEDLLQFELDRSTWQSGDDQVSISSTLVIGPHSVLAL
jgi:hypothetical protein